MKIIAQYKNNLKSINYSFDEKWIEIKMRLIKLFNLDNDYIDLEFINERPIREFGKQALVIGLLERIYDDYFINEFITRERELNFLIHPIILSQDDQIKIDKVKKDNLIFTSNDFPLLK